MKLKYKELLVMTLGALLIEVFFFNFRYWESLTFKQNDSFSLVNFKGIEKNSVYGTYEINDDLASFEIVDIHDRVDNLYLNIFDSNHHIRGDKIDLSLDITDAGNSEYLSLKDTEIVYAIEESQYLRLHLIGATNKIRINIKNCNKSSINIENIGINVKRPLMIHKTRLLIIFLVFILCFVFRPKSIIYKHELDLKNNLQKLLIICCIILNMFSIIEVHKTFYWENWRNSDITNLQYNYVAESLLKGHVYLDIDTPKTLNNLDNPYDTKARNIALKQNGEQAILDVAYYDGKYYSYFGVVPVILFFLPYLYFTGNFLSVSSIILLFSLVFILCCYWFVYTLIKKYNYKISVGHYILITTVFCTASELLYCVQMQSLYGLPICLGVVLDLLGITCWLNAAKENGDISKLYLIVGAICIALVIGCRPQLAIALFFAFPVFWKEIKERKFFSIKGLGNTLSVIIPFLIIGLGLLYYNYLRFSNPLDFGATYNLTGFDMTHRGFVFDRFILGFFEYLFQPFNIYPKFPYIYSVAGHMQLTTDYQGQVINEPLLGGFFAFNIIALTIFLLPRTYHLLKEKQVQLFVLCSLAFGIIIINLDIQMVGMTLRYLTDFSIFLMIPVILIILTLLDKYKNKELYSVFHVSVIILSFLTIITNFFTLIASGRYYALSRANPEIYYLIKYLLFSMFSIR